MEQLVLPGKNYVFKRGRELFRSIEVLTYLEFVVFRYTTSWIKALVRNDKFNQTEDEGAAYCNPMEFHCTSIYYLITPKNLSNHKLKHAASNRRYRY